MRDQTPAQTNSKNLSTPGTAKAVGRRHRRIASLTTVAAALFTTLLLGATTLAAPPAQARAIVHKLDIPAQDLASALKTLGAAADEQILFSDDVVAGLRSGEVKGEYSTDEAVMLLLKNSGLKADRTPSGVLLIRFPESSSTQGASTPFRNRNSESDRPMRLAQAGTSSSPTSPSSEEGEEGIEPAEVVVVGTHIRGAESTSPTITFDRQDIERGGYSSVQDLFSKVPQNFSGTNPSSVRATLSNLGFTSQIDLRGLGSEATLTLVNGRRISSAAGDQGRAMDVSMIPIAAIERIDILADGASALYGSDAIGGVVNIVLRRDFEGAETTLQYGDNTTGADHFLVSQLVGTSWSSGRLLGGVQYDRREALKFRELGITTTDFSSRGGGDFRLPGFGSPGTVYSAGFFAGLPFTTLTGPGGSPVFTAALPPGDGRDLQLDQLALNQLSLLDLLPPDATPRAENAAAYLMFEQDLGAVTFFADGVFGKRESRVAAQNSLGLLYVPSSNAFSPFDEDVFVGYEFADSHPTVKIENEGWFLNTGVRGTLAADWTWEVLGMLSHDRSEARTPLTDAAELALRLASPDPLFALNPFGDGSDRSRDLTNTLFADEAIFISTTTLRGVSAQSQGRLLDLPGGAVRLALGSEYRNEEFAAATLGFPSSSRDVAALYVEGYVPLIGASNARAAIADLVLSVAARYEHYNDFGDTLNPKVGVLWRPAAGLAFKANWGTSFRAPLLRELFAAVSLSENFTIFDPNAPGGPALVPVTVQSGGNENLKEETADTYTVSAEYLPGWLDGGRLSFSYFRTEYEDRIRGLLDGLTPFTLLQLEDSLSPGIVVRAPDGTLQSISNTNINSANTSIAGYDLAAGYLWSTGFGTFDFSASGTLFDRYEDRLIAGAPVLELEGRVGNPPEWRGRFLMNWQRGIWGAALAVNHVDNQRNELADPRIVLHDVDSQTTLDVQFSVVPRVSADSWLNGFTARLGASNVLDERPPFVDEGSFRFGIDPQNSVLEGRTVYLRLSKGFGGAAR